MVKIIDIDLERRRISLSLKQANDTAAASDVEEFDPTLYGMAATYDDQGNYVYPDGFDPETGEWLEGYDEQRATWEEQYAKAHERWEAHVKQQARGQGGRDRCGRADDVLLRLDRRGDEPRGDLGQPGLRRGAPGAPREAHRRRQLATTTHEGPVTLR